MPRALRSNLVWSSAVTAGLGLAVAAIAYRHHNLTGERWARLGRAASVRLPLVSLAIWLRGRSRSTRYELLADRVVLPILWTAICFMDVAFELWIPS